MMTQQTPAAVAAAYFDALGHGDVPAALGMFSPQVVWHQPGANQFSGEHVGTDAVGALLGAMMRVSEGTFRVSPTGPGMANGELVAVPVRFVGAHSSAEMDMAGVDLLTVRDGVIAEVHLFSADGAAEDAFWG